MPVLQVADSADSEQEAVQTEGRAMEDLCGLSGRGKASIRDRAKDDRFHNLHFLWKHRDIFFYHFSISSSTFPNLVCTAVLMKVLSHRG